MRKIAISMACVLALASCTTSGDDIAAAIKSSCNGAEIALAAIQPWAEAGRLSEKNARIVKTADSALFDPVDGICVKPFTGNLAALFVRVSSFALNVSLALRDVEASK